MAGSRRYHRPIRPSSAPKSPNESLAIGPRNRPGRPAQAPRGPLRALSGTLRVLLGLTLALSSCVGAPSAEDLLNVGFRTPKQSFRTFQTAVRGDYLDLEYRCWSPGFRRRNGLAQHVYREGRRQLLADQPWFRWIAKAEVVTSESLGPDTHRLVCQVEVAWIERRFEVQLVRTGFIELFSAGEEESRLVYDDYMEFERAVRIAPHPDGGWDLFSEIELWPENAYGDPTSAVELRIAQDWQIDDLRPLDEQTSSDPPQVP